MSVDDGSVIEANTSYLYKPRPYQNDALESVENLYWNEHVNRQLIFWATGLGKSSGCMMHLPIRFPHHVLDHGFLFLAHRRKILKQAYTKFAKAYPRLSIGLDMGEHSAWGGEDAVFASVESLGREYQTRIEKYRNRHFGVIVADEGHHVKEDSTWDRILNFFGVGSDEDQHYTINVQGEEVPPLSLFLTATPTRNDEHTLAPFLDEVASEMSIIDGISRGWLTDIKAHRAWTEANIDELSDQGEIDFLVQTARKFLQGHRTLVFARSVDQSERLCHNINEHDIASAAHIYNETPPEERKDIYEGFENGDIDMLCNRLVLCLDEETEILTRGGWVGIDEMSYDHRVANYWQEDGSVTWQEPKDIVRRGPAPNEKMVVAESGRQDFRVSRWHNMIVRGEDEKVWAEDLVGKKVQLPMAGKAEPENIEPEQPHQPSTSRSRFISYTSCSYRKRLDMGYEESKRRAAQAWERKVDLKRKTDFTDPELMFAGFWVGDGTRTQLSSGGVEYSVTQSKTYQGIIQWFDSIIDRCGFDVVRYDKGNHIQWSFGRGTGGINQEVDGVYPIEHLLNKNGPDALWGLSKDQFTSFIQGLWMADGNHGQAESVSGGPWIIHNTNEKLIDTLQAIAATRGFGSRKGRYERDIYTRGRIFNLWIGHRSYWTSGPDSIQMGERPDLSERLWCVTTHSGNIITRRNGCVTVMGNTEGYDNPAITAIMDNAPTESQPLHIQKIGRGLRAYPKAQVDKYDTAEERKAAIRRSPKPHLLYISTFDPTKHGLDVVAQLTEDVDVDPEGDMLVEEVVDVIEEFEEEMPEIDVSDFDSVKEIEVTLQKANVLTQTVYNEELKAVTPLNWVVEKDKAALYLHSNPFTDGPYESAPCIVEFEKTGDETFMKRVIGGGWNGTKPLRNRAVSREVEAEDLHQCIKAQDEWLEDHADDLYYWAVRESSEPATEQMRDYLRRKNVPFNENLTKETARILIDREKIKQKRKDINE